MRIELFGKVGAIKTSDKVRCSNDLLYIGGLGEDSNELWQLVWMALHR